MMIDGFTLAQAIDDGKWKAFIEDEPVKSDRLTIGSNSVNLTLGPRLIGQRTTLGYIDPVDDPESLEWFDLKPTSIGKFVLHPGQFCLGYARERIEADEPLWICHEFKEWLGHPDHKLQKMFFVPMFEGRSTMGRLGLAMHITAGFGDYGFGSNFTMEINNVSPNTMILTPGMQVAQLHFESVTPNVHKVRYSGAYAGKNGGPHPPVLGRKRFFKV